MTKQLNPEGLEAAEVAFYGRHEKGFICKPLIADENGRYDLAKAITTYLSVTPAVDLPGLEVEPVAWVSFAEGEPSLTGNEAELKKLMAIGPGPHAFYPASAIEKLRAERDGAQTKADDANELLGWVILSLPSGYGPGERGQGPVQGVKGLRARAETAEASVATLTARAERAEAERDEWRDKWIAADEGEKLNAEFLAHSDNRAEKAEQVLRDVNADLVKGHRTTALDRIRILTKENDNGR